MGFGNRLKAAARTLFGGDAPKSGFGLLSGVTQAGLAPRRGTAELLLAYKRLPRLRAVTHRIGSDVAGIPLRLYAMKQPRRKAELSAAVATVRKTAGRPEAFSQASHYAKAMVQDARASGDLTEIGSHPLLDLYRAMNPALRGEASRLVTQLHLDLIGEAFWVLERAGSGHVLEAWPIPPHWVLDVPSRGRPFYRVGFAAWHRDIPETDMLWFRSPDPLHPYARGTGIAESLADELDVGEYAAGRIKDWFKNGAMPESVIAVEGASEEALKAFREKWLAKYQGAGKGGQTHFTNGKLTAESLGHTFKDQELLSLRRYEDDVIRETFGVPPEIVGQLEHSNRATIDASYLLYSMGVLCPRMEFICASLEPLLAEWDERLVLDYVSPVPEDREFKRSIFQQAPAGTFSRNEYRELGSMAPVEDVEDEKVGELFQYHFMFGVVTINEARARLGLPPIAGGDKPPDVSAMFGPGSQGGADEQQLAADPVWVKELRPKLLTSGTAGRTAGVARKDVDESGGIKNILEALRPERLTERTDPLWQQKVEEWATAALEDLGIDPGNFDMKNPLVRDIIEDAGKRITGVTETTREKLMATLNEGVHAGEGIDELAKRVEATFDEADSSRARMIARTEVVGSSNKANVAAWEISGVVEQKEWLSVRDGNTRPEHAALDGQRVKLSGKFKVDGKSADAPGGFGDPGLDINCRCTALPIVADIKSGLKSGPAGAVRKQLTEEQKAARWKAFDQTLLPWEDAAEKALKKGFAAQKADVLAALRKAF